VPEIIITIAIDEEFADQFVGFLKNLITVNKDKRKKPIIRINSIQSDQEIVAYPKLEI